MSFRGWLSLITVVLLAVILFASRHELVRAWELSSQVNLWILLLLIPVQIMVYFASGEMIFSYLRDKGKLKRVNVWTQVRISLEGNFVNHVLPSGGVSGVSYLTWRLNHLGVSAGKATMAQVVRHAMGFLSFASLLLVALVFVTLDGNLNRWIILASAALFTLISFGLIGTVYLLSSKRRIDKFAHWSHKIGNDLMRHITFGRRHNWLREKEVHDFLDDMHGDFLELRADKKLLVKPYLWGLVFNILDASLFLITFWALGVFINPAPILIAYGVASLVGFFVLTPGGAGAYEAIMVTFLAFSGIASGIAIAGILLARVMILLVTIVFGYVFYQHALSTYGNRPDGAKAQR